MKPFDKGDHKVVWRCLGCGFMMEGATDDYIMIATEQSVAFCRKESGLMLSCRLCRPALRTRSRNGERPTRCCQR